jgi:hypothetical protein
LRDEVGTAELEVFTADVIKKLIQLLIVAKGGDVFLDAKSISIESCILLPVNILTKVRYFWYCCSIRSV